MIDRTTRVALIATSVSILGFLSSQLVAGVPRCIGDACITTFAQPTGGCYTVRNSSNRRVRVRATIYVYELQPGETAVMRTTSGCIRDFGPGTSITATYLTPDPSPPHHAPSAPANTPADHGPIEKTVTQNQPSGDGDQWSDWYHICNDPIPPGYVIRQSDFHLEGDRGCGAWANCRQTSNASNEVCWDFQMQGHNEGGDGVRYSRGVLHYKASRY